MKQIDGPTQSSNKKEGEKDNGEQEHSKGQENAIEEFPTMGVSWKDLQDDDERERSHSSLESGQVSDDIDDHGEGN